MDASLWIAFILVSALMWWAAFYATKRMRIKKNEERERIARQRRAEEE